MGRVSPLLGFLPILVVSSNPAPPQVISEVPEISNWPVPPYWTHAGGRYGLGSTALWRL